MSLVMISVDRDKLPPHTDKEFEEWIKYQVGQFGGMKADNPLADYDLEAIVREIG